MKLLQVEVSRLLGGDPLNWREINRVGIEIGSGGWSFKSDEPQVLNGASIGRVDDPRSGRIPFGFTKGVTTAVYTCTDKYDGGRSGNIDSSVSPTATTPANQ